MTIWVELVCDKCASTYPGIHAQRSVAKERISAMRRDAVNEGWVRVTDGAFKRDYCPNCVPAKKQAYNRR